MGFSEPIMVDQIVASVDGEPILASQLQREQEGVKQMLKLEKREQEMDQPIAFKRRVLMQMIEDRLIDREIKKLGLEATEAQVTQVLQNIMKENGIQNMEQFKQALKQEGLSFEEFEANYRKRISRNNYIRQNIQPKIKISDDDLVSLVQKEDPSRIEQKRYYDIGMVTLGHSELTNSELAQITTAMNRKGAKYNELSKQYGTGPMTEMGQVNEEDLEETIREALNNMKEGERVTVVELEHGKVLIQKKGEGRRMQELSEEEKARLTDQLFNERVAKSMTLTIERLKQNATIEIFI